jgi:hypothetical protein
VVSQNTLRPSLSSWSTVSPKKLLVAQFRKQTPVFHGDRIFINLFTNAHHVQAPLQNFEACRSFRARSPVHQPKPQSGRPDIIVSQQFLISIFASTVYITYRYASLHATLRKRHAMVTTAPHNQRTYNFKFSKKITQLQLILVPNCLCSHGKNIFTETY